MENKGRNERGVYVEGGDAGGGGPPPWYANPLRDPKDSWVGFDLENIGEMRARFLRILWREDLFRAFRGFIRASVQGMRFALAFRRIGESLDYLR